MQASPGLVFTLCKVPPPRMLTMIPAQYGVSLTSRDGLMLAMRKPTTVTAMPRASCSRASSSGNLQPQHVGASSPLGLGAPGPFFGPMVVVGPGGRLRVLARRRARGGGGAGRGASQRGPALLFGYCSGAEQIWQRHAGLPGPPEPQGGHRGVANCQREVAAPAGLGQGWPVGLGALGTPSACVLVHICMLVIHETALVSAYCRVCVFLYACAPA